MYMYNIICKYFNNNRSFSNKAELLEVIEIINIISNFITCEQKVIKTDNSIRGNIKKQLKYRYDDSTWNVLWTFFSKIEFISDPKIGTGKSVKIVSNDSLYSEDSIIRHAPKKYDISKSEVVYIINKIKDSFMHVDCNGSILYHINNEGTITINNISQDFSLQCKIPISEMKEFIKQIEKYYDDEIMEPDIISKYKYTKTLREKIDKELGVDFVTLRYSNTTRENYQKLEEAYKQELLIKSIQYKGLSAYAYLTFLFDLKKCYPILLSLSEFDCRFKSSEINTYASKILDDLLSGYDLINQYNGELPDYELRRVKDLFFTNNQGKQEGIIYNIMKYNDSIIKNLRNSRSHANFDKQSELFVLFQNSLNNSSINMKGKNDISNFELFGTIDDMLLLLDEINNSNYALSEVVDAVIENDNQEVSSLFFQQLSGFLVNCYCNGSEEIRKKAEIIIDNSVLSKIETVIGMNTAISAKKIR